MDHAETHLNVKDEDRKRGWSRENAGKDLQKIHRPGPTACYRRKTLGDMGNLVGVLGRAQCAGIENGSMAKKHYQEKSSATPTLAHKSTRRIKKLHEEEGDLILSAARLTKQRRLMGCENIHDNNKNNNKPMDRQKDLTALRSPMDRQKKDLTALRSPMEAKGLLGSCGISNEVEMQEANQPDFLPKSPNIDEQDIGNPLAVIDYIEDIHDFYQKSEMQSCVSEDYMKTRQPDINEKMRAILIDWLIEVHLKFKFMPETLFLTVNLIDRFLVCSESIPRKNLQLVGIAAMLIASKYEEIWAPEVQDFVFISDKAYTRDHVLHMEKEMLNKLEFKLSWPTPYVFLLRFLKAAMSSESGTTHHTSSNAQLEMMAFFLLELCMTEYCMVRYCPSHLAAAAVYTAALTLHRNWTPALQHHSGYTEMQLRDCAMKMVSFHRRSGREAGSLRAVHNKYSNPNFHSVATLDPLSPSIHPSSIEQSLI